MTASQSLKAFGALGMLLNTDKGARWWVPKIYDGFSSPLPSTLYNSWDDAENHEANIVAVASMVLNKDFMQAVLIVFRKNNNSVASMQILMRSIISMG